MKSVQRGEGTLSVVISIALITGYLSWVLSDFLPAQAEDLQKVVLTAAASPDANAVVVESLKETPNPNRIELRHMRSRVNEIIVTETARKVTGDKALETPSERNATLERQAEVRLSAIESKAWGEMSNDERADYLASKWWPIAVGALFLPVLVFGLHTMRRAEGSY